MAKRGPKFEFFRKIIGELSENYRSFKSYLESSYRVLSRTMYLYDIIWYYLSYPIRYLLRHKVERYKIELEQIRWRQQHIKPKARRRGMTETVANFIVMDMYLSIKYERFIKRWSL